MRRTACHFVHLAFAAESWPTIRARRALAGWAGPSDGSTISGAARIMPSITIHIRYVNRSEETLTITGSRFIVGREAGDIILNDPQVSWDHGALGFDASGDGLIYDDLGSSNGSFLSNGQEISGRIKIVAGQALHIGNCVLTVKHFEAQGGEDAGAARDKPQASPAARPNNMTSPGWPAEAMLGDAYKLVKQARARQRAQRELAALESKASPAAERVRTPTGPQRAVQTRSLGAWYEVRANDPSPQTKTYVMGLSSGVVIVRVRNRCESGYDEALITCAGSLDDFDLVIG